MDTAAELNFILDICNDVDDAMALRGMDADLSWDHDNHAGIFDTTMELQECYNDGMTSWSMVLNEGNRGSYV